MKTAIIKMLMDEGGYISGEELSSRLEITRAAVWKHICALREDGCLIDAQTNKGYHLKRIPDLLKPEYIRLYQNERNHEIRWHYSVDSTNDAAKDWAQKGAEEKSVVVTEHQTKGKGRLRREWVSHPKEAVKLSMVFRPDIMPFEAPAINFCAALGVSRAIYSICGVETQIKWPNDVVYGSQKLCGILTEMTGDMDRIDYIICGIGINANQRAFEEEALEKATSLRMIQDRKVNRCALCAEVIEQVFCYYQKYINGGMEEIMDEYREKSAVVGKDLKVIYGKQIYEGNCTGFLDDGQIVVDVDGKEMVFNAGEVSLRGMADYV